jgi:hypothetical protein
MLLLRYLIVADEWHRYLHLGVKHKKTISKPALLLSGSGAKCTEVWRRSWPKLS